MMQLGLPIVQACVFFLCSLLLQTTVRRTGGLAFQRRHAGKCKSGLTIWVSAGKSTPSKGTDLTDDARDAVKKAKMALEHAVAKIIIRIK